GASRLEEIEAQTRRRFYLEGKAAVSHDHFAVLDEGTLEKLAPKDAPVGEGQAVEVKLVEVGRHDAGAGVAKLDGWSIQVGVVRVLDGNAYAVPADGLPEAPSAPITAEAQAEKPTRASRAKKPEEPAEEAAVDVVEEGEAEEQAPAKKKTRRGSRGGRGRK